MHPRLACAPSPVPRPLRKALRGALRGAGVPALCLALAAVVGGGRPALADDRDRVIGEATELTETVRAETLKHLEAIAKADPEDAASVKAAVAARRAVLRQGPAVWPVVENALRLNPSAGARPHLHLVKALLAKKQEPEFEALRARLRKRFLMDDFKGMHEELSRFRQGLPNPAKPGKFLPHSVSPTKVGATTVYRSGDGSIVLAYGADADANNPDAPEAVASDPIAGFVAVLGGKPFPFERQSGRGADTTATAPAGFAWSWASDGAPGKAPGGSGGTGGSGQATGGAGVYQRSGAGGAGASG